MDCFTPSAESRVGADHPHRSAGERKGALGSPIVISGYVQHGRKLGRALGAPTANIPLATCPRHLAGSYAAEVFGLGRVYQACAHLGVCPSVGGTVARLETHLLDFDADIYGALLTVRLLCRVSDELRLDSLAALERKIARDVAACRAFFAAGGTDALGMAPPGLGVEAAAGRSPGWVAAPRRVSASRRRRTQP